MGRVEVVFKFPLNKDECAKMDIANSDDLNGWYLYDKSIAYINLGSIELGPKIKYSKTLKWFTRITAHETLHSEIYKVTNKVANDKEEEIIDNITGGK